MRFRSPRAAALLATCLLACGPPSPPPGVPIKPVAQADGGADAAARDAVVKAGEPPDAGTPARASSDDAGADAAVALVSESRRERWTEWSSVPADRRWRIPVEALQMPESDGSSTVIVIPVMPRCERSRCSERVICREFSPKEACPSSIPGTAFPSKLDVEATVGAWKKTPHACCFIEKYDCRDIRRDECPNL
jgi:hypothetical protein